MNGESDGTSHAKKPVDIYANQVRISLSVYDVTLFFGTQTVTGEEEPVETQAIIRMSPQHAKSLHILLDRFIATYESEIAEIELPEALVQRLRGVLLEDGAITDDPDSN